MQRGRGKLMSSILVQVIEMMGTEVKLKRNKFKLDDAGGGAGDWGPPCESCPHGRGEKGKRTSGSAMTNGERIQSRPLSTRYAIWSPAVGLGVFEFKPRLSITSRTRSEHLGISIRLNISITTFPATGWDGRVGLRRQIKVLVRKGVGSNPTLNK